MQTYSQDDSQISAMGPEIEFGCDYFIYAL